MEVNNYKEFLDRSKAEFYERWEKPFKYLAKLEHFKQIKVIGAGAFGTVLLVKHKRTGEFCAMKSIEKAKIVEFKYIERVRNEKNVLACLNFPFTVFLKYFAMDNVYIHLVMPFVPGGELLRYVMKNKRLAESTAKFYASQLILVVEYLHYLKIIYRDLKLENILIDRTGFIKVIDFGLCKTLTNERTYTMCGTVEYLAPEVILLKGYGFAADWWAMGVLIYELVKGVPPYNSDSEEETCARIITNKYSMPRHFSRQLKDLVKNILQTDLSKRFGNLKKGVDDIKGHKWLREINWLAMLNKKVTPPYIPIYETEGSTENFETVSQGLEIIRTSSTVEYEEEFADF